MASLRYEAAFDLCGAEPRRLNPPAKGGGETPPGASRAAASEKLLRIVESEIIPRLVTSHAQGRSDDTPPVGNELVEKFALYSLGEPPDSLLAIIGGLLQQGVSLESIYLDLLGPAAKRLGEFWADDSVSYVDVTIALGRLQQVVRELSIHGNPDLDAALGDRAALFAPTPGEQHTFGLVIIEEFFRRAGWRTWTELAGDSKEIEAAVATHHFDLFGMTASCVEGLDRMAPLIKSVRRLSRNRDITVLVGGRLFLEEPDLVARVGADGMALDARDALVRAEGAVRKLARR